MFLSFTLLKINRPPPSALVISRTVARGGHINLFTLIAPAFGPQLYKLRLKLLLTWTILQDCKREIFLLYESHFSIHLNRSKSFNKCNYSPIPPLSPLPKKFWEGGTRSENGCRRENHLRHPFSDDTASKCSQGK